MSHKKTSNAPKVRINLSDVGPGFGSRKFATAAIRGMLTILLSALLLVAARPAQSQTETVLYNFTGGSDGASPQSRLTFDAAGNLYGTATQGGLSIFNYPQGAGVVFELSRNGLGGWNETVLYAFNGGLDVGPDGVMPNGPVTFDKAGNLLGATQQGGTDFHYCSYGTVFELTPRQTRWTESILYSFSCNFYLNGTSPTTGVIIDAMGNLYGSTPANGPVPGTVFELSPSTSSWTYQAIYNTGSESPTGLTMDAAGNIYGATTSTVFKLSPNGSGGWIPAVIYTFTGYPNDGFGAMGTPALDRNGNLYGTTYAGGTTNNGTVYRLTPGKNGVWTENVLYSFASANDGANPVAGITLDKNGNIYGTTSLGNYQRGNVFELKAIRVNFGGGQRSNCVATSQGSGGSVCYFYVPLWSFKGIDGATPYGGPVLDSACNLYGTTAAGGLSGKGVVYQVSLPKSLCLP